MLLHDHGGGEIHCRRDTDLYLKILFIGLAVIALEIIGSGLSGSLSLFSDAMHAVADTSAVGLSLFIEFRIRNGSASENKLRSIGGKISSSILFATAIWIGFEAVERIFSPVPINTWTMLIFALLGTVGNISSMFLMRNSGENLTSASLKRHIIIDSCQSLIVIFTAGTMILQPKALSAILAAIGIPSLFFLDPILSIGLSLVAVSLAAKTWKESSKISQPL